jgi:tripartite-type tricarboxylate transporter receptor subunit TctC
MITRRKFCATASILPVAIAGTETQAQATFPGKTIQFTVPYPGGDGTDVITRLLGLQLAKDLGVSVIVDNKPGAAGLIGAQAGARLPADGHNICFLTSGHITLQTLYKQMDLLALFRPVTNFATAPYAFVVPTHSPYKTFGDLVAAIRAKPSQISMATGGMGSPAHMAWEMLRASVNNLDVNHIPFKSGLESAMAVAGGQVDFASSYVGSVLPLAADNKLRVLAVTSKVRIAPMPNVPTVAELMLPGWSHDTLLFFAVPRSTPQDVVAKVFKAVTEAAKKSSELQTRLDALAHQLDLSPSPAEFEARLQAAINTESKLIVEKGLKAG